MKPKIITEPHVSVFNFILFTVGTLGIYPFIWYAAHLDKLNELVPGKTLKLQNVIVLAAMSAMVERIAGMTQDAGNGWQITEGLLSIALTIAIPVYQYLKIVKPVVDGLDKVLLRDCQIDLRPNRFFAFVFGPLYLVHVINKVPQMMVRSSLMAASSGGAGEGSPRPVDR